MYLKLMKKTSPRPQDVQLAVWLRLLNGGRSFGTKNVYGPIPGLAARPAPRIRGVRNRPGRCHELSFKGQSRALHHCGESWTLVQGLVDFRPGLPMVHSWLEQGSLVYDPVLDLLYVNKVSFFVAHNAVAVDRLNPRQSAKLLLSTGSTGPWWDHIPVKRLPTRTQLGKLDVREFRRQACLSSDADSQ